MTTFALSSLAVVLAYLIGAIPFGYLVARWVGGVDIRTVGSGNIGATNVGRALGFRFFVLVFALDLCKGLLPTLVFPRLFERLSGHPAPTGLAVFVALAAVLGHVFPVYLKFKGGKAVAASLGAVVALDPASAVAAAVGFLAFVLVSRYVSVSSVLGGLVFALVHFTRVDAPWSPEGRAMSAFTVGVPLFLAYLHRKNFARVAAGTEPKVNLRKRRKPPEGRAAVVCVLALAAVFAASAVGLALRQRVQTRDVLTVGRYHFEEVARAGTGHQRAERVAFADGGRLLAVTCPRYDRLVLYRVTDARGLDVFRDLTLDGQPVAVCPTDDRFYVLMRPPGDRRHVEAGWWQALDFRGEPVGGRVPVGYYPDDLALSPDGRLAYVLTSGRAEGEPDRPRPCLSVYDLASPSAPIGRVDFEGEEDDPARVTLSARGQVAAVTLLGSNTAAAVDLYDPSRPILAGRTPLADLDHPYPSRSDDDWIVMPVASGRESTTFSLPGVGSCVVCTLPRESGIEVYETTWNRSLGRLTLRSGTLRLGKTRPTGLAFSPDRHLIAVANRSGGVHLLAARADVEEVAARSAP